ncbi:MAG: hydrogenase nickel incorporation protein HypB [Dysgonamonadaceae bacterium]|jgi:hydrogenase nickel incorporation protein HypB|nr:hydrogenase nickel incorporation protein HypB [Dysgonamonadaceae bacterium]
MCSTCGCGSNENGVVIKKMGTEEHIHYHSDGTQTLHSHGHKHAHPHEHSHSHTHEIKLEQDILGKNQLTAEYNRGFFEALNILCINLVSSPGSGKTTFLERSITDLKGVADIYVIEGDQQTSNDAERINKTGAPAIQINTGRGCHLDSEMVSKSLRLLNPKPHSILLIENVGNLVCPAMFDLGEALRAVIVSVTEGEDKPLKYPDMFHTSHVCIINKTDLLPHLKFDLEKLRDNALKVNPKLQFFEVSAESGQGMGEWYQFLKSKIA